MAGPRLRASRGRCWEEFEVGDVYEHRPGRTIADSDNTWFTLLTTNQHPLHFDAAYAARSEFRLPVANSCLTLSTLVGMSVAVIDPKATRDTLDGLKRAGVTGIRLNLETAGVFDPAVAAAKLDTAVKQIEGLGWHLEIYSRLPVIEAMKDRLGALPVPVVFDHFGSAKPTEGVDQPGFATMLSLVKSGKAYVTLSGAYLISNAPGYTDVAPLARALIAANPERMLWGSNWPHPNSDPAPGRKPTDIAPAQDIDNGVILNLLADWAPDAATRSRILVENPKRLYGF